MPILTHQRFTTTLTFSEADGLYVGRIEGLPALVSFQGETLDSATAAFVAAVDDYVADGGQPADQRSVLLEMSDDEFESLVAELEEMPIAERKQRLQQMARSEPTKI